MEVNQISSKVTSMLQEILKQIHLLKNELRDNGWSEGKPPTITQPSFLRTDIGLDEPSHRFD